LGVSFRTRKSEEVPLPRRLGWAARLSTGFAGEGFGKA
jgi:hypothetical protein